jgi:excisionase family DNA binding protein
MPSAEAVARELGVTERTVRRALADGRLEAPKNGGVYDIDIDDARRVLGSRASSSFASALEAKVAALEAERDWLRGVIELLVKGAA